jgi:hypothetical protein
MPTLSVKVEYNQAAKLFPQMAKKLPSITARAINKTANAAKEKMIDKLKTELRLPRKIVANRLSRNGGVKESRFKLRRASPSYLAAELSIYARGIPVYQVAGMAVNPYNVPGRTRKRKGGGVKAKGPRFYEGAFKVPSGQYAGMVFKRRTAARDSLMMPKIGERKKINEGGNQYIVSTEGHRIFKRIYNEMIRAELSRYGVRV